MTKNIKQVKQKNIGLIKQILIKLKGGVIEWQ